MYLCFARGAVELPGNSSSGDNQLIVFGHVTVNKDVFQ